MAWEKSRHREVHKYYQSWLDSIGSDATSSTQLPRYHEDGSRLRTSKDQALIAFAQLGCLRLDAKRTVITLISTDQQYILAEATKTLSLVSGDGDSEVHDQIWFGMSSMPRAQGISGDVITPPNYTATDMNGQSFVAPALVVNDLRYHPKYHSRPYVGNGVTFYCGVPIKTDGGVPIGVYTVTDDKPRNGLKVSELRFMCDMAAIVMRHLQVTTNEAARFRGETMVLGLGRFISGASTLYDETLQTSTAVARATSPETNLSEAFSGRTFKGLEVTATVPSNTRSAPSEVCQSPSKVTLKRKDCHTSSEYPYGGRLSPNEHKGAFMPPAANKKAESMLQAEQSSANRSKPLKDLRSPAATDTVFSRAATILQECVAADGVLFFDAISASFSNRTKLLASPSTDELLDSTVPLSKTPAHVGCNTKRGPENNDDTVSVRSAASEDSDTSAPGDDQERMCQLLGHSMNIAGLPSSGLGSLDNVQITERSLSRLVKTYPEGKLFSFNVDMRPSAGDTGQQFEATSDAPRRSNPRRLVTSDESKRVPRTVADELERLIPDAQSIIWLPLWDFSKQRWSAGLFLWSTRPHQLVSAQDDLVYLKAFANSIMTEIARSDATTADTAKSTFIANISHELRTPLHGILGNLHILQDTKLSGFQHSLLTAIEVCGRTLSDTIDHVLDHAKINQLSKHSRKRNKSSSIALPSLSYSSESDAARSLTEEDFDISIVVEEAIEATYASHAFQASGKDRVGTPTVSDLQARDKCVPPIRLPDVQVILSLQPRDSWWVRSQSSAIRRVVTNLFGNALKYTDQGTIQISLTSAHSSEVSSDSDAVIPVSISIKDTGRGMSPEFVRNHAFVPFCQESHFSTGIGLGLSIVQQIVKSLGGKIELRSDKGVGTEITVMLSVSASSKVEKASRDLVSLRQKLIRGRMNVQPYQDTTRCQLPSGLPFLVSALENMAKSWFDLPVVNTSILTAQGPLVMLYVTPPTYDDLRSVWTKYSSSQVVFIVLATDMIEKAALVNHYSDLVTTAQYKIDVLSHPVGPHKFGQVLLRCLKQVAVAPSFGIDDEDTRDKQPLIQSTCRPQADYTPYQAGDISEQLSQTPKLGKTQLSPPAEHYNFAEDRVRASIALSSTMCDTTAQPQAESILSRSISEPSPLVPDDQKSAPVRVLLVDDNDINLNILKTCMKRAQIPFDCARDGLEASNAFKHAYSIQSTFTHVLMDINMPVMDGIQSTREIRDFERRQNNLIRAPPRANKPVQSVIDVSLPNMDVDVLNHRNQSNRALIFALSGVASEAAQLEMLEAGADVFLPKPVKLKELIRMLRA